MPHFPATPRSRLPRVGTTIFTVMSRMAQEHGAINLSQGFPDFNAEPALFEAVSRHMHAGRNQYAPMAGTPELRSALANQIETLYGTRYDIDTEVTITAGATQGLYTAITALVHPGDEVIIFEPVYDSYVPAITLAGGIVKSAWLRYPDYRPNWDEVRALITPATAMIIVNTPHNPTGSVWSADDMAELAALTRDTGIVVLSDEVYEHMVFDGARHESVARHPELAARSVIVSSFGKTYHITGWKVGHVAAPAALMAEFRKVHQFNVFTVNTPVQLGLADYMTDPSRHLGLAAFYQQKRDFFRAQLAGSGFELLPTRGTYFQCARFDHIRTCSDVEFVRYLTQEVGVAAIPVSAFYANGQDDGVIRFCFAKNEDTLARAGEKLRKL